MGNYDFFTAAQNKANKKKSGYDFLSAAKSGADYTWNDEAKKKYTENNMQELKLTDGTSFGKITPEGYKAIENNTLDSYIPKNDEEKKTIEGYKQYTGMFVNADTSKGNKANDIYVDINKPSSNENKKTTSEFENQPSVKAIKDKYGLNVSNITPEDMMNWAKEHNFTFSPKESNTSKNEFVPKKDGFLGLWGNDLPTEEEKKDAETILALFELSANKKRNETPSSAVDAFGYNFVDFGSGGLGGSATEKGDEHMKKNLEDAGIDSKYYTPEKVRLANVSAEHPVASTVGALGGVTTSLYGSYGLLKGIGATSSISSGVQTYKNILKAGKALGATKGAIRTAKLARTLPTIMTMATPAVLTYNRQKSKGTDVVSTDVKDTPLEFLEKQIAAGNAQYSKQLASTLDLILPTDALGKYDLISKVNDFYGDTLYSTSAEAQKSAANLGWETAGEAIQVVTAALPNSITALFLAGANVPGQAIQFSSNKTINAVANFLSHTAKNPQYWTSVLQTLGTDYEEAKSRGANDTVATAYAVFVTAINAGIELGGFQELPNKLMGELAEDTAKRTFAKGFFDWLTSSFEEGGEEVLQSFVSNTVAKIFDHETKWVSETDDKAVVNLSRTAKEFGMGMFAGMVLSGGQIAAVETINRANISRVGNSMQDLKDEIIAVGLASPQNSEGYKIAQKLSKKKGNVSDYQLGRLHIANTEQYTVSVGDKFKDNKTGNEFTVVNRDDEKTTVEIETPKGTTTKELGNERIDNIVDSGQAEKIMSAESEADELMATDMSEDVETPVVETPAEVVAENETTEMELPSVKIGEIYKANGKTYTIMDRDDRYTTYTVTDENGNTVRTERIGNVTADTNFAKEDAYTKVKSYTSIEVGNVYRNNESGVTYTVVSRDSKETTLRNNQNGKTKIMSNDAADNLFAYEDVFTKIQDGDDTATTTEVKNEDAAKETTTTNKDVTLAETTVTEAEISAVVNAMNNTLKEGALEAIYESIPSNLKKSLDVFTEKLIKAYRKLGNIGNVADFFTDGGKKVIDAIEGKTDVVSETKPTEKTKAETVDTVTETAEQEVVAENATTNEISVIAEETTITNVKPTTNEVTLAEGEILSLKHTKNVYSLFKGAMRIVVGKDIITDGFVVLPLTDESLAGVKKVIGDSAPIQENPNFEMSKFYHADNDVVIHGNPKLGEAPVNNKTVKAYTFKIGDAFYSCQQKFIDAFNNGKNVIKANKSNNIPWTVHNENGDLVALFLGLRANVTEQSYNQMQSVAEIKSAEQQKKAENANKPFNHNEVRLLIENGRPFFFTVHGINYVGDGHIFTVCDEAATDFIKGEYRKQNANSNYEIEHKDGFGGMVEKLLAEAKELAEANNPISYSGADTLNRAANAYIVGDYAILFNKKYADLIKKRSKSMKIISNGKIGTTILVGYDADGNITGLALPILVKGEVTTKDGKTVPFVTELDLKNLVKEEAESGIKSDKSEPKIPESVTEPTESVIKKADSVTETPENEKITVGMSDDVRAELLNKKSVNVVSFDAEKAKALDDIDFDALQKTLTRHAKPIIEKVAKDFGILNKTYFNPDIELDFEYSRGSLKESMNKQHTMYGDFVKMLSVFSDVIKNAVGVETHEDKYVGTTREDASLKQMYVLASALSDETGIIPVKLEVKEFNDKANKLYLSVVLTKKESRYPHGNLEQSPLNTATPASTISIADLVGIVNPSEGDFLKYFPDSMLDSEQIESKNKALAKEAEKVEKLTADKKRSLATAENANALSSTPETTNSTAPTDSVSQDNDTVNKESKVYDVAYFDDLGAAIRKGESVSLKDVRTAVDAILMNHGEAIKTELSQLKNDELKKRISIYDRGRITKKAEMVDSIYTDMLSSLYYALSGKDTITYIYDGTSFEAQQSKMLFDISRELTEETFNKRLAENAEKYKKQLAAREEKLSKVKNPQTLEDYAYKKRYFGLSDEETIQYENLYAEERRKAREDKKAAKTTKDTSGADAFFANADNYTIEKTTHTKTGDDVWVVRPTSRLETEQWKQLNEQMKALGGSYWRGNQGWNFKNDPTAALSSTEETATVKGSTNAEKLRAVAESMQKAIDDKFRDRLTNTAKRAREAASAEAEGERLKRLQDTINNIADALENGENTLLDKIDSKAQVETLMSMLRTGRRNRISETLPDITYDERLQEQDKPYSIDDAKYAEYPLTKLHESAITEYIRAAEGKTGYKQITDRLKKSLKSVKNGYVTVDAQMFADIDKIVQNLSTYRADFWNDGVSERKRLARMGIENVVELRAYLREFIKFLPGKDADAERQRNIKAKERQLANAKIEGFFPTPKDVVGKMLEKADIAPDEKVLEPSAGKGNIADEIKSKYPDNVLDVVEWNGSLNELLTEKGHNVVGNDFLQISEKYDKIVMNPPFEKGQDIDHIKHAYSLLNDGGRVVCIMSEGPFYRSDKKATEFREWLDSLGGVSEKLPDGSFKNSERSTGVNTRLVVIDKTPTITKISYSIESEELSDEQRESLLFGNGDRGSNESTRKQAERISKFKQEIKGETKRERRSFAKELLAKGQTEEVIDGEHLFNVVKPEAYNDDMLSIVEKAKANGKEVGFFIGHGKRKFSDLKIDAIKDGSKVLLRYDGSFSPQTLMKHEDVHIEWNTSKMKNAKDIILSDLSEADKKKILTEDRYKKYMELYKNDDKKEEKVWEEFVADVMAGMNEYTAKYIDTVVNYWYGNEAAEGYSPSTYAESIDAGNQKVDVVDEGQLMYSMEKWYPDLSRSQLSKLNETIKRAAKTSTQSVTDTANWMFTTIGNTKIFAIYSTENATDPTLLYEAKGKQGEFEKDYLLNILEVIDNGTSDDGKSNFISRVLDGGRLQTGYSVQNSNGALGRGQNSGNVAVLQGKSKRKPSGAFKSVIENLFQIQNELDSSNDTKYSLATDGILDLEDLWTDAIETYDTIPKGENPARDIDVPQRISPEKVVSRFARTMLEAGVTPDWAVSEFEQAILDGDMTHEVITNKNAREWAIKQIEYHGFEGALNQWYGFSATGEIGKRELALGMELYNQCVTNKDVHNAMKIAADLAAEATNAGQTLQACRMLKLMSPDGQLYYLEKSIQKMNEEFKDKLGDKFKDIELDESLMEDFFNETDEEKRNAIYDDICQDIADQIPATMVDKWNSWRYLAMLGNLRTHMRNIWGNAVFVPSIRIKNYIGAVIEKMAKIDTAERTKSFNKSDEAIEFAKNDFKEMIKALQGENAKYAVTSDIEGKRTIFKTEWLEKVRLKNFEFLEKEDMWFLKMHYTDALARLITVRNIDVKSIDAKTLEKIRAIAVKEAQAATYRDANSIAEGLNVLQKKLGSSNNKALKGVGILIEGVMPFKKTPMNIAKQGINYSPVGILKGIYKGFSKLKDGSATTTEVIDDFAKGLTGTGMMLLGLFLAKLGLLVGAGDKPDKEKEFNKMVGEQDYSINIGDWSYTIDWATPSNLSLFIGAELYNLTKDEFNFADIVSAVSTISEPLLELSVFNGVNGVIESAQYSEGSPLLAIGSDMATSYFMQALPTIGGQLSRIIDDDKKEYYYVDKNKDIPKGMQRLIGQASSKIPFASYLFETAVDEWGREETYGNILERVSENIISPGYYSKENYTNVDKVLKDLYEKTGETSVLPIAQQKYYEENYIRYDMTAKEYTEAKKMRGQKSFKYVNELLADKRMIKLKSNVTGKYRNLRYSQMSDDEKVRAIKKCYEQAGEETKETMLEKMKQRKSK